MFVKIIPTFRPFFITTLLLCKMIYNESRKYVKTRGGSSNALKIYGTLGFSIGGLIVGLAGDYMLFALIFMGLIGSIFLTIPAHSLKLTILTAILGSIGFFVGSWVTHFSLPWSFLTSVLQG